MTSPPANAVNLDANAVFALVAESSPVRHAIRAFIAGRALVLCATAESQVRDIVSKSGGPLEQARAARLLARVTFVPDGPSSRAAALRPTNSIDQPDIIIFGTGDALGIPTATSDAKALRAAAAQGVAFQAFLHPSNPLTGQ